jgi:hypothetical protein
MQTGSIFPPRAAQALSSAAIAFGAGAGATAGTDVVTGIGM